MGMRGTKNIPWETRGTREGLSTPNYQEGSTQHDMGKRGAPSTPSEGPSTPISRVRLPAPNRKLRGGTLST